MSYGTVQAEKMTTESGYSLGAGNASSFKNRIINGGMTIDQRNAGASVTAVTTSTFVYTVDRWSYYGTQGSKYTVQQNAGSVTPPAGFTNYLGVTSSSAYSPSGGDLFMLTQVIEGFNVADLAWGTASAKAVTLSFWVRSSLTGTFGGSILSSSATRSYPFSYTISSANTWTQISITVPGDTSGTWVTNNGHGAYISFSLGVGTTYASSSPNTWSGTQYWGVSGQQQVVGTNGATFYITGVQFEVGTVATSFDFRSYGTELALCQRYGFAYASSGTDFQEVIARTALTGFEYTACLPVTMRTTPTLSLSAGSVYGNLVGYDLNFNAIRVNVTALAVSPYNASLSALHLYGTNATMSYGSAQGSASFDTVNGTGNLFLSAEL